jgi:branched-chain amino acid transport system ATP-binding protein
LTIRFGGHVAVNNVTCAFEPGTLTAIVGPNGAGKTTYFNLISGQLKATSGTVSLDGRDLSGLTPSARTRAGLGRAFQLTNLFPNLTVLENVRLAVQATKEGAHRRGLNLWSIWSDHAALTQRALEILDAVSMAERQQATVASLPHGDQRKLEVALLMALESSVFMFDEPTAGMNAAEAPVILNLIRKLKERQDQDHPAGGAQDGRGARAGRPHHRAAQRHAGGRWRPCHRDRFARGARGLPGRCQGGCMSAQPARALGRAHAHRGVPHPAWR